ncbi:MAG: type III pantothenate kinase [Planctomycetia bacterium]|nr:type III pantothenate kinase [Planctomycetia bacterium]
MTTSARPICDGDTVLLADVGNSRIKLAVVADHGDARRLPAITRRHDLDSHSFRPADLEQWLQGAAPGPAVVLVASVHDAAAARLEAALAAVSATGHRPLRQRRIVHADLPLAIAVPEPDRVGIDRLCGAAAATIVKPAGRPAIVVDCGTAATVDLVVADGTFTGGAILPGPALMARALADGTSKLPEVAALGRGEAPAMPGRSTHEAIAAGIGFGTQGAIARLVAEGQAALGGTADVILTGGWRGAVRAALPGATEIPDLVLHGIALAASRACAR